MFREIYDSLLTLAYPQSCHLCQNSVENSSDGVACRDCWQKTRVFSGAETLCRKCGAYLHEKTTNFETFCHRCDAHFYDRAVAVGVYENAISASVLHLKNEPFISRRLRNLFLARFEDSGFQDATKVIPVPLSKKRFLERGFNQAAVVAEILAGRTKISLDEKSLSRILHTPSRRAAMDNKAREMSVKNAFEVKRPKLIENETILLVDDIFTSGSTASHCAKVLKTARAKKVYVLTLARAVNDF